MVAKSSSKPKSKASSKPVVSSKSSAKSAPASAKSASKSIVSSKSIDHKKAKGFVRPAAAPVAVKTAPTKSVSKSATAVLSAPKKGAKAKGPVVVVKKAEKAPILPPHRPAVVAAPVPTNGKPRKNQAGLSAKELEHYRELLLLKRRELVGDMSSMEREALRSTGTNLSNLPLHMADQGTDNYEQEFTLGLVEKDRQLLRELNTALAKIMDGSYGICEGTGKPISKPRLEAQPWAKFSIEHARAMEKGMLRR